MATARALRPESRERSPGSGSASVRQRSRLTTLPPKRGKSLERQIPPKPGPPAVAAPTQGESKRAQVVDSSVTAGRAGS
jgi:hypothetical protein